MSGKIISPSGMLLLVALQQDAVQAESKASRKPNILIIITDDQGFGDLSFYGNTVLETPNLDRLAAQSAQMDYFYASPVCAPTRAALLTGRNPMETGVWGVHWGRDYLALDEVTLADVLRENRYDTAMVGKWHSGRAPAWMPWNRGFNEAWASQLYNHFECMVSHNGRAIQTEGWACEALTNIAMDWIRRDRGEQPFFMLMSYMAPHGPWEAPEEFIRKYRRKGCSERLSILFGMIDHMDHHIGRLLDAMDQSGLSENTLVVFLSDNGPTNQVGGGPPLSAEDAALRNPRNLRGVKGNIWENGIRVPCFIRWPGRIAPGTVPALADVADLFPTILEATGIATPSGNLPIHGVSLMPVLTGRQRDWPVAREWFKPFWQPFWREGWNHDGTLENIRDVTFERQVVSMRQGGFKMVRIRNGPPELYYIPKDNGETRDLAHRYPEKTRVLHEATRKSFEAMLATGRCFSQPRFHIGHPQYDRYERVGGYLPGSVIPMCSSVRVTGNVVTKSHHSSGWVEAGDSQTVLVDVVTPGLYEVELAANQMAPGAEIRLEVGHAVLEGLISARRGAEVIGTLKLEKGPQEATLHLISLPQNAEAFDELRTLSFALLRE